MGIMHGVITIIIIMDVISRKVANYNLIIIIIALHVTLVYILK